MKQFLCRWCACKLAKSPRQFCSDACQTHAQKARQVNEQARDRRRQMRQQDDANHIDAYVEREAAWIENHGG